MLMSPAGQVSLHFITGYMHSALSMRWHLAVYELGKLEHLV